MVVVYWLLCLLLLLTVVVNCCCCCCCCCCWFLLLLLTVVVSHWYCQRCLFANYALFTFSCLNLEATTFALNHEHCKHDYIHNKFKEQLFPSVCLLLQVLSDSHRCRSRQPTRSFAITKPAVITERSVWTSTCRVPFRLPLVSPGFAQVR